MHKMLDKMKKMKGDHKVPDMKKKAGLSALSELMSDMDKEIGGGEKLKKVSVMSNSDEGLKKGLDMAKKLKEMSPEGEESSEEEEDAGMSPEQAEHEGMESSKEESEEHEEDPEALVAKIEELKRKLEMLKK